jgi:hypothetical protein
MKIQKLLAVVIEKLHIQLHWSKLLELLLLLLLLIEFVWQWLQDDYLVEEPFEDPCYEPSGTRTPPTPDVSPSHAPPPPAPFLLQRVMVQLW